MQATSYVMMIRPARFGPNPQTIEQEVLDMDALNLDAIHEQALKEFDGLVQLLREHDINVLVFEDVKEDPSPDALFPSDWVSFHSNGSAVLYPLEAPNRRKERRKDILEHLKKQFILRNIIDLTHHEAKGRFLEGTGSMALDRTQKVAYACLSPCTHPQVLSNFGSLLQYRTVTFQAVDAHKKPIRHTDAIMSIGTKYVIFCMDAVTLDFDREVLRQEFKKSQKEVIEVSHEQVGSYCCNVLEVMSNTGIYYLVMSSRAYKTLTDEQKHRLERYAKILHTPLDTIEQYGKGSVRSMLTEIHLPTL
ncbi:citrulline utilization hydrolase CtlX [Thermonema rossianum]|uniref:citrulline utilization hydrolase CtlX n=1 Tax=Thermonema rossianum TaxID=55505 RepID=UPI000570617B|nr:arginine deiminase-related protein [Thermonema rossianum]